MQNKVFKVGDDEIEVNMTPIEMLSCGNCINFEDIDKCAHMYDFILSHLKIRIGNTFVQIKQKNDYWPQGIESDLRRLQMICVTFIRDVLKPFFTKSVSSNVEQKSMETEAIITK